MLEIMRGTTPDITCNVNADLTGYTCYLDFGSPNNPRLRLNVASITTSSGSSTLVFHMSQEESLKLKAGETLVQVTAVDRQGTREVVARSHVIPVMVFNPISTEVVHDVPL